MPRTKVKLAFIENGRARKSSFMKRKESLKKKLQELCILCDVMACMILYSPYTPELELWPEDNTVFHNVLNQFLNKLPMDRSKNMFNQEGYLKEMINKAKGQLKKQKMANRKLVNAKMLSDCLSGKISVADLSFPNLNELVSFTGPEISKISEMMKVHKGDAPAAEPTTESQIPQPEEVVGAGSTTNEAGERTDVDPYVRVMENSEALDDADNTDWYPPDWLSDQKDGLDLVPGPNIMKSFPKDPDSLLSDAVFPKQS